MRVTMAVTFAVLGAGIGVPISAEVEESRAEDAPAGASGTAATGGPARS